MTTHGRVAACQFEPVVDDVDANIESMASILDSLALSVELAVFPELCVTGYALDVAEDRAETVPGPMTDRLSSLAADSGVTIVAGVPERREDHLYNSLVTVDDDGLQGVYRKQYPWGDETETFTAVDEPVVVDTDLGRVGFLICYDANFPEAAIAYSKQWCDLLVVSAAWRQSYREDWRLLLRARALDGACYVVGSNHAGDQRGRRHEGGSLVANPRGKLLAQADHGQQAVTAPVSQESIAHGREKNPVHQTREEVHQY